ncbi:MATE family efflux transporter [Anaerostipes sp. MSJ-23]|uniref:MATE family efflux transporter n=1 Tax=Anaerostipes sp. MSJ-23 TaxID=2841520 RepID=UPI002ED4D620
MLLNQAQWGLAQMIQTAVLGHLGAAVIAANSIAVIVFQMVSVFAYGAAGIVIGRTIGENNMKKLRQMVRTLEILFLGIGIFSIRNFVLEFYHISGQASFMAKNFMCILAVTSVGTAYQMACDNGIIQGGGDTSFSMKMNLISMWLILVPCACIAAFVRNDSALIVFFILKSDQLYKIIPVKLRLERWKWVKKVTRE